MNCDIKCLDIDSYDLDDVLKLFNLTRDFDETGLRNAKRAVLKTHPDKSGLDKEYFLFFTKAYKILHSVYEFKTRSNACVSVEYATEEDTERKELVKCLLDSDDFNNVFNELFEKNKLSREHSSKGYGDWLKSNDDIDTRSATRATMNQQFEEKKEEMRALAPIYEVQSIVGTAGHSDIVGDEPLEFASDVFSSLQYEDLRKAHTETVVPVTDKDRSRLQFRSAEDLRNHRSAQDTTPLSLQQAKSLLGEQQSLQNQNDMQRAFKLARQDEEARAKNNAWLSSFKQLKNS